VEETPNGFKRGPRVFPEIHGVSGFGGLIMTTSELYLDDLLTFGGNSEELVGNFRKSWRDSKRRIFSSTLISAGLV
jgi:hypothetical protein